MKASLLSGAVLLRVCGEIDMATFEQCASAVNAGFAHRRGTVIVDLRCVGLLASSGIGALIEADQIGRSCGQSLRLVVGHQRAVINPMLVIGVLPRLCVFRALEDAASAPADSPGEEIRSV